MPQASNGKMNLKGKAKAGVGGALRPAHIFRSRDVSPPPGVGADDIATEALRDRPQRVVNYCCIRVDTDVSSGD